ncbi:MAG: hypothetical protein COY42_06640 [Armatimonadetes bacterium CG_4_10_14_0_8_um_filter_66_14]|nr:MAG: hypothetical protein COY42_06640 [Armatimonadetes bacterium CG_4_10_14_0_8_um_filter_66_14]
MNQSSRRLPAALVLSLLALSPLCLPAADWPAYRHDFARSGVTTEQLPSPLHLQWTHAAKPPRPAWPEPGRELNKLAFDYAYDTVVANGLLYFGSSADYQVHCLDLNTGQQRWSFVTEGPVRFAPVVEDGRLFVASDDGYLYCLSAADGKLLWKFYGGPKPDRVMGNEQLVSRWLLRSGVSVDTGVVYLSAGMWPTEGVYLYALRANDGSVVWKQESVGAEYRKQPHPGSFSMIGLAPQGYLVADADRLFVPTGRNAAAAYDRNTGKESYYHSAPYTWNDRWGGTWCFQANGLFFGWRMHLGPDIDVLQGEYQPDAQDGLVAFEADTSKLKRDFPGKLYAVATKDTLYAWGSGKVTAYDFAAWAKGAKSQDCTKWETEHPRAYSLILAGNTLFVGGANTVTALDAAQGKLLWQEPVTAQARSLAVADGRLLVSTTDGRIACFGPQQVASAPTIEPAAGAARFAGDERAATLAKRLLAQTEKDQGYCLAIGAGDGSVLYELAKQSQLTVYCVEADPARAESVRRALDAAGLYGQRVVVQQGTTAELAYPDYFADAIVAGDGNPLDLARLSARELYRVLRPHGGCLHFLTGGVAGGAPAIEAWLREGGVPAGEIQSAATAVRVVRGVLPGSSDWTHQYANAGRTGCSADESVKLPVKLLWFGEPGPMHLVSRHWGGPAPLCANGRMFVIGQFRLTAVDAYNGRELWHLDYSTPIGRWPIRNKGNGVAVDDDSVYIATLSQCLRLDAATGKVVQTYELPPLPAGMPVTEGLRWSYLAVDGNHLLGSMGTDQQAWAVFMMDKDGKTWWVHKAQGTVNNNSLSMDDRRVYLLDAPDATAAEAAKRRGEPVPTKPQLVALDVVTGNVQWQTAEGLAGRAELWLSKGILLATGGTGMTGYDAATGKQRYTRDARISRFPVLVRDTIIGEPAAWDLQTGAPKDRLSPFTKEQVSWNFLRSYGCGSIAAGPNLLMFRSGTLGFYDLAGDSGVHNFSAVRAGCYVNVIAADGLVLAPPADAGCTCCYNFQTTVALVPTTKNEEWSIFYDRLPNTTVNRAALNLGAPGDHRDAEAGLWIGAPRPETQTGRGGLDDPFRFEFTEGGGPYHYNSDHLQLAGTDKPWVYANGLKGLRRAELDLSILDRGVTSWPVKPAPVVDGQETDACWDGYRAVPVPNEKASVTLRHDDQNLYVAYQRPPAPDDTGKVRPWKAATKGADAPVWQDDSCELYFSSVPPLSADQLGSKCLHLGVSASGARYDGSWEFVRPLLPTCDVPRVEVTLDGDPADWADKGLVVRSLPAPEGKMRAPADFDPSFRVGWNDKGLVLLAQVKDNKVVEAKAIDQLWKGDSLELFVTPALGTGDTYQCVIAPGADPNYPQARSFFYDSRKAPATAKLSVEVAGKKAAGGYVMEVLLPWRNLNLTAAEGKECGLQLFANDQDNAALSANPFRVMWHPAGHPVSDKEPFAYQPLRLSTKPSAPIEFKRSEKPGADRLFTAIAPLPFPLTVPLLGANTEDAKLNADWTSAVRADAKAFAAEFAIPWKTLEDAGLTKADLILDWTRRGPLAVRPTNRQGYERMIVVADEVAKPRALTVRLHFAEVEDAKPGQRVFDVKLQGKTVLTNFDLAKEAGDNRAVVREFDNVVAARALTIELVPKGSQSEPPVISAVEIATEPTM